jgi:hypothetical protein
MQSNLTAVLEVVKLLGSKQEKLTEKALSQERGYQELSKLVRQVLELRSLVMQGRCPTSTQNPTTLGTLQAEVCLLEAGLPADMRDRLGGEHFQSRADVLLFVEKNVPSNAFFSIP